MGDSFLSRSLSMVSLSSRRSNFVPTKMMGVLGQWCLTSGYHYSTKGAHRGVCTSGFTERQRQWRQETGELAGCRGRVLHASPQGWATRRSQYEKLKLQYGTSKICFLHIGWICPHVMTIFSTDYLSDVTLIQWQLQQIHNKCFS